MARVSRQAELELERMGEGDVRGECLYGGVTQQPDP